MFASLSGTEPLPSGCTAGPLSRSGTATGRGSIGVGGSTVIVGLFGVRDSEGGSEGVLKTPEGC